MPPKKAKITIKKEDKKPENKKIKKLEESSLKSTDSDSIDDDEYDSEDISETMTNTESETEESEEASSAMTGAESGGSEDEEEEDDEADEEDEETESEASEESQDEEEVEADDECLYRKAKVKNLDKDDDNEELEEVYDDDNLNFDEVVKPENRITKPFMTIFERVRLLGDRAKQLSLGAKPMIKGLETMNPKEIAKLELEKGVLPLIIERVLPNGRKERWRINELQIIN